ncbi:MAG: hypothetical protein N2441_07015 [Rhodocyclaceae bacterium]|nr:hypothetical protein [Rhodocyclaceae bacterium]
MTLQGAQPETIDRKPRHFGQKIAFGAAVVSFVGSLVSLGFSLWAWARYGKHVYTGSLFATTFFFFSAAIVLYEMSRPGPRLPPPARDAENDAPRPRAPNG